LLRLATWNIRFGHRLALVLESLDALPRLDLVALQELSVHRGQDDAELLARRLGPGWRAAQITAQVVSGRPQANGFVWDSERVDVRSVHAVELPTPSGRVMRALPKTRRNAVVMEAGIDHRRIRLYAVHLDVFGISHKHAQLAHILADALARDPVDLVLIAGDLNTYGIGGRPRWSELRRLANGAGFEELTVRLGWTHQGLGVRQKLDAIFAAPQGVPHRTWRLNIGGSDHIPVLLEVDLDTKAPPGSRGRL
jgi:endonuclease/exonuclease/phosphatase family metal-dependent hydrolase